MNSLFLSRNYLDSLSSSELFSLADAYGIDVPRDLDRNFIIGELLEIAQEEKEDLIEVISPENQENSTKTFIPFVLPDTYNETQIGMVLRNPVWSFIFWDISDTDKKSFLQKDFAVLKVNLAFFGNSTDTKPYDNFDIQIEPQDTEQFVLLPTTKGYCQVSLIAYFDTTGSSVLCQTPKYQLPQGDTILNTMVPGKEIVLSPIMQLSGKDILLRQHFENHRQAFSTQNDTILQ